MKPCPKCGGETYIWPHTPCSDEPTLVMFYRDCKRCEYSEQIGQSEAEQEAPDVFAGAFDPVVPPLVSPPRTSSGMTADQIARCSAVLADAFGGLHRLRKIHRRSNCLEVNTFESLATFDGDILTRLVLAAHRYAARVEIGPSGPGRLKIYVHPRTRLGGLSRRHPTIGEYDNGASSPHV